MSTKIKVTCPNGHKLAAEERKAGKTVACPVCGVKLKRVQRRVDDQIVGILFLPAQWAILPDITLRDLQAIPAVLVMKTFM